MKELLLSIAFIILIQLNTKAQCNNQIAGSFMQADSCTGYPMAQTRTAQVSPYSTDQIIISNFSSFLPPNDVFVVVDCNNNTLSMFQTLGTTNISGSGTFSTDFSSMTLNFSVDFGTSTLNCTDVYTRIVSGVDEEKQVLQIQISPNPVTEVLSVSIDGHDSYDFKLFNSVGQLVYGSKSKSGQAMQAIDMHNFPAGLYSLTVMNGFDVTQKMIVKI